MTTTNINVKKSRLMKDLEKFIDDKDRLHENYEIQFNGDDTQLVLTDKKLIVAEEIGLISLSNVANPKEKESRGLLASLPLENFSMTSNYGYRSDPFSGERKVHRGIDLKANRSEVLSM